MYDKELTKIKSMMTFHPTGAYVAGGALTSVFTNAPIADVDVYFKSREAFVEAVRTAYEDERCWCVNVSKRAVTFAYGDDVMQFMYFDFFPEANDIFKAFDFTVCMGAVDLDNDQFVLHEDFLKHNSQRFLQFNPGTRFPIASALRVLKYLKKGYTIGNGELLKIVLSSRLPVIESRDALKDQIGGAYGNVVALENDDKPYSPMAAVEAFSGDRVWEQGEDQEYTKVKGDWESLLEKLGFTAEMDKLYKQQKEAA